MNRAARWGRYLILARSSIASAPRAPARRPMPPAPVPSSAPQLAPRAVRLQFARRAGLDEAQFLYAEIARRMAERLTLIKLAPAAILDCGCGGGSARTLLLERYRDARYLGLDSAFAQARGAARHAGTVPAWQRWLGRGPQHAFVVGDAAALPLAGASVDLVWSNLMLHWHGDPPRVFAEWHRVLRPEGLLLFSSFGPDSCKELRAAVAAAGLDLPTLAFVDMHDFGDMMIAQGYADPVMDQERLCLRYADAERLLAEVHALGGNAAAARRRGLLGRHARQRLIDALEAQRGEDGRIALTFEVAYGHAWRVAGRSVRSEALIPINAIGGRRPRGGDGTPHR